MVAGVLLAACSSSPNEEASSTTTHSGAPTTTATTGGTTTSTTNGSSTCQAHDLNLSAQLSNGAAGQVEWTVTMKNTSATTCTLEGYPGMQLYDSGGTAIPTNVVRGMQTFATAAANQPPAAVALSPGGSASFAVHFEDVPTVGESVCPTSATAQVTPPNDFSSATVAMQIAPCSHGTVHVSPVYSS